MAYNKQAFLHKGRVSSRVIKNSRTTDPKADLKRIDKLNIEILASSLFFQSKSDSPMTTPATVHPAKTLFTLLPQRLVLLRVWDYILHQTNTEAKRLFTAQQQKPGRENQLRQRQGDRSDRQQRCIQRPLYRTHLPLQMVGAAGAPWWDRSKSGRPADGCMWSP